MFYKTAVFLPILNIFAKALKCAENDGIKHKSRVATWLKKEFTKVHIQLSHVLTQWNPLGLAFTNNSVYKLI